MVWGKSLGLVAPRCCMRLGRLGQRHAALALLPAQHLVAAHPRSQRRRHGAGRACGGGWIDNKDSEGVLVKTVKTVQDSTDKMYLERRVFREAGCSGGCMSSDVACQVPCCLEHVLQQWRHVRCLAV